MASVTERVFGIDELLEHILLSIHDTSFAMNLAESKELFQLQRVNRTFQKTITGSTRLRFEMGIGLAIPADHEAVRSTTNSSPYLKGKAPQIGSFSNEEVIEQRFTDPDNRKINEWDRKFDNLFKRSRASDLNAEPYCEPEPAARVIFSLHVATIE